MNRLREIFEHKAEEVKQAKRLVPEADLRQMAADAPPARPFRDALHRSPHRPALIAEIKKASPSKGLIREDFDPASIAEIYRASGADCLSVLTDERYFLGSRRNLELARDASALPCLRKDFLFDPYQIYESRAWGADCVLLIAAALSADSLAVLYSLARELGMDVLVEVRSEAEVESALAVGADLIGVNNRDLTDMSLSLEVSEALLPLIGPHAVAVSESALETREDLLRVEAAGARAVLIGTAFCASRDIGQKVREVMGW